MSAKAEHGAEQTVVEMDAIDIDEWDRDRHTPRAHDINLACAGVTVLADVAVEAQRSVALPFSQSLALQKINR